MRYFSYTVQILTAPFNKFAVTIFQCVLIRELKMKRSSTASESDLQKRKLSKYLSIQSKSTFAHTDIKDVIEAAT
jgi:hypothetical protein